MSQEPIAENASINRSIKQTAWIALAIVVTFLLGIGSGYLQWGRDETNAARQEKDLARLREQVNPASGYALPVSYGRLGPELTQAGVIDLRAVKNVMTASGDALSNPQLDILNKGSDQQIVISAENAHFLLNFFWAVGLANRNAILTEGPMAQNSEGKIDQFASTGGWTLGKKPVTQLYASLELIPLTAEQQSRVEESASAIYRPCCNNPTLFPDCNHGMAMLGLLELMAARGATTDQMLEAAKHVNAYWFLQQTMEIAFYFHAKESTDFAAADARRLVGKDFSSASGSGRVHQTLLAEGLLKQASNQGGGCTN